LRDVSQSAAEDSVSRTRHQRPGSSRRGHHDVGNGGSEIANGNDASQIHAASRSGDIGRRCVVA
jgi:hypothetical protein